MNQSRPAPAVSHDLQMQVVVEDDHRVALSATLDYSARDPFAMSVTFHTGDGNVTWVFARDLLRDGIKDAAGEGDIRFRPAHPSRGPLVCVTLSSPSGVANIEAPREELAAFVHDVYTAVPDGAEWMYLDLDTTIDGLLGADPSR
jgi:hypothetical protein